MLFHGIKRGVLCLPIFPDIDHVVNYEFFSILVQQNKEKKTYCKKVYQRAGIM